MKLGTLGFFDACTRTHGAFWSGGWGTDPTGNLSSIRGVLVIIIYILFFSSKLLLKLGQRKEEDIGKIKEYKG